MQGWAADMLEPTDRVQYTDGTSLSCRNLNGIEDVAVIDQRHWFAGNIRLLSDGCFANFSCSAASLLKEIAFSANRMRKFPTIFRFARCTRVSRRFTLVLPEFCLQFAEFAESCRTPAELFRGTFVTGNINFLC